MLGSATYFGGPGATFDIRAVTGRPTELAFVAQDEPGRPAYEGTRMGRAFTTAMAIAVANRVLGGVFPKAPGTARESLPMGGPSPSRRIPATVTTEVRPIAPYCARTSRYTLTYRLTFTEAWDAKDFKAVGAPGKVLTHRWVFRVSDNQFGSISTTFVSQSGDFPPQQVR